MKVKKNTLALIVEDELIISLDLQRELKSIGFKTQAVKSAEEAVKIATDSCPDIIIMDITLKGNLDGITAAFLIDTLKIPIIIISAQPETKISESLKGLSCEYLSKPYDVQDLKDKIYKMLEVNQSKPINEN